MTDKISSSSATSPSFTDARLEWIERAARRGIPSPSRDELAAFADGFKAAEASRSEIAKPEKRYDLQDMETFCTLAASKMHEACVEAVRGQFLEDPQNVEGDTAYQHAIEDCLKALNSISDETPRSATAAFSTGPHTTGTVDGSICTDTHGLPTATGATLPLNWKTINAAPGKGAELSSPDHSPQESSANIADNAPVAAPLSQSDKPREEIMPQPEPGAYLCESTEKYTDYWKRGSWNTPDRAEALICMEQAVNGWKNLAYSLAKQAHFYLQSQPSASLSSVVANESSVELLRKARAMLMRAWEKSGEGALGEIATLIAAADAKLEGKTFEPFARSATAESHAVALLKEFGGGLVNNPFDLVEWAKRVDALLERGEYVPGGKISG